MATHIKKEGVGLGLPEGICSARVENLDPPFTLSHNMMPPGHRSRAHYHTNCARGTYIAKGRIRFFFGPECDQQVIDAEAGDYIYTARGEIHAQMNLSDTEPAEYTSTYVGVSDDVVFSAIMI